MSSLTILAKSGLSAGAGGLHAPPPLWCGIALVILAVAAGSWLWLRRLGEGPVDGAGRAAKGALPLVCPACRRAYPSGTTYCAADAQRLVTVYEGASPAQPGGRCPRCRRIYEAGTRFCPLDAEALAPLPRWPAGTAPIDPAEAIHDHEHLLTGDGKICPQCASRYDLEASFCGRDGVELVTVN